VGGVKSLREKRGGFKYLKGIGKASMGTKRESPRTKLKTPKELREGEKVTRVATEKRRGKTIEKKARGGPNKG